ncbi:MAG: hypothetical protein L6R40_004357 [Gallowayella cf. fulva]|nr:MAG: hypothetical protein L6R40_004357 [Xanthomendoza cf. fulva]
MAEPSIYDEIELEDLTYHADTTLYTYPCPCGDQFEISLQDLRDGEDIAELRKDESTVMAVKVVA